MTTPALPLKMPILFHVSNRVGGREFVTSFAMGLPGVVVPRPANILSKGDRLQMCGVHAEPNPTQVIDSQAGGDWSYEFGVGPSMGKPFVEHAVPVACPASSPKPTRLGLLDLRPESGNRWALGGHTVRLHRDTGRYN